MKNEKIPETASGALRSIFGFESFRPNQEEIVGHILAGRDVFAVMPTGGGKSLCYQLPAWLREGTAVVISPLIALMKDQVDAARENGIPAVFINSSMSPKEISGVCASLKERRARLLYIAPERFMMPHFLLFLKGLPLSLFAIDEAHCISEWGHDFRPDYMALSCITKEFPGIPVAAFTATATPKVQDDIITRLGLRSPYIVRASFNRPNLFYEVKQKARVKPQVLDFLRERSGESGIIYRTTRDSVTEMAEFLTSHGIKALPYHAGLSASERSSNQEAFSRDEAEVIVATIAFGMGIDKSNVRFVVHADLPKNIESYYQETGRAGRDGDPAHCLLLFSRGDVPKIRYFIDAIPDATERSISLEKLNRVVEYAEHAVCRRKRLLNFFGEEYPAGNCGNCDICTGTIERKDITTEAQIVMSAISRTGQRFGAGHIADIVTGADTKRIRELGHHEIRTFGAGKGKDKAEWRFVINELIAQEMLSQEGHPYPILKITPKGAEVLYGRQEATALQRQAPKSKPAQESPEWHDEALFERLRILRKEIAKSHNVPPYVIFSDKTLREMSRRMPETLQEMRLVSGVGDQKLGQYGEPFLSEIGRHLAENPGLRTARHGDHGIPDMDPDTDTGHRTKRKKGDTAEETYELFCQGMSPEEISRHRKLSLTTISGHLGQLLLGGRDIDIDRLVDRKKRDEIAAVFRSSGQWALTPVIEHGKGGITYEEARIVRAWLQRGA